MNTGENTLNTRKLFSGNLRSSTMRWTTQNLRWSREWLDARNLAITWSTSSMGEAVPLHSTRPVFLLFLLLLRQGKEILCQHSDHSNQVHLSGKRRASLSLVHNGCRGRRYSWTVPWNLLHDCLGWSHLDKGELWILQALNKFQCLSFKRGVNGLQVENSHNSLCSNILPKCYKS